MRCAVGLRRHARGITSVKNIVCCACVFFTTAVLFAHWQGALDAGECRLIGMPRLHC